MCAWRGGHHPEETIGPYRTLSLLGRGAFGEVLLAEDTRRQGHLVALKIATCGGGIGEEEEEKTRSIVLGEAELLRRLQHPHIVVCEDVCWDLEREQVWLALELMDGGSVRNLIESRRGVGLPFDAHFLRRVLGEIGGALEYIHSQGVLHRDVKPANILLTLSAPPVLKLADFGISKILQATGHAQSIVGTQYYFSPELASGRPYGPESDAWALGVCLYELAALRRPFVASSPFALAMCIVEDSPPALPAATNVDLLQVIMGLLEKDVDHRLRLASAMTFAGVGGTERFLADEAVPEDSVPESSEVETACISVGGDPQFGLATDEMYEDAEPAFAGTVQPHAPSLAFGDPDDSELVPKSRGGVGGGWWLSLVNALRPSALSLSSKAGSGVSEASEKKATLVKSISSEHSGAFDSDTPQDGWKRSFHTNAIGEDTLLVDAEDVWDLPGHTSSGSAQW